MQKMDSLRAFKLNYLEWGADNVFKKIRVVYLADRIHRTRKGKA